MSSVSSMTTAQIKMHAITNLGANTGRTNTATAQQQDCTQKTH